MRHPGWILVLLVLGLAIGLAGPRGAGAEASFESSLEVMLEIRNLSLLSSGQLEVVDPEQWTEFSAAPEGPTSSIEGETEVSVNFTPGGILLATILELRAAATGTTTWDGRPGIATHISGTASASGSFGLINRSAAPLHVPIRVTAFYAQAGTVDSRPSEWASSALTLRFVERIGCSDINADGICDDEPMGLPEGNLLFPALLPPSDALRASTDFVDAFDIAGSLLLLGQPRDYTITLPPTPVEGVFPVFPITLLAQAGGNATSQLRPDGTSEALLFAPEEPSLDVAPALGPLLPDLGIGDHEVVPGDSGVLLDGTTVAARPELAGIVRSDPLRPFEVRDGQGSVILSGTLQDRVVESNDPGTLIFASQLRDLESPVGQAWITGLRVVGYGGSTTEIDFRTDGPGDVGPRTVSRSADGEELFFRYDPDAIVPPQEGHALSVLTDAVDFAPVGTATVFVQNDLGGQVFSTTLQGINVPVPRPPALAEVLPADASIAGKTLARWSAEWWKFAQSFPGPENPVSDRKGEFANLNQIDDVFYISPADFPFVQRVFSVPAGRPILVAIDAVALSQAALGFDRTEDEIREAVQAAADEIHRVQVTIDGEPVPEIAKHRHLSPPFELIGAPGNPFVQQGGVVGRSGLTLSDGYFVALGPLEPGDTHVLHVRSARSASGSSREVVAVLSAVPQGDDRDGDGVPDDVDACPYFSDDQTDTDDSGRGDACECGDQTGDGRVNIADILETNDVIFDLSTASPLCDTNDDDRCDVTDILGVNAKIFGALTHCARYPAP